MIAQHFKEVHVPFGVNLAKQIEKFMNEVRSSHKKRDGIETVAYIQQVIKTEQKHNYFVILNVYENG